MSTTRDLPNDLQQASGVSVVYIHTDGWMDAIQIIACLRQCYSSFHRVCLSVRGRIIDIFGWRLKPPEKKSEKTFFLFFQQTQKACLLFQKPQSAP